jgi:hypothetical protein
LLGDEPIIIELFYGFEGVLMGLIMGSQNIMGLDYGSNISEAVHEQEKSVVLFCCHNHELISDLLIRFD